MNPFYFGSSSKPLFGVYNAPRTAGSGRAVVMCYPMGAEYMRAHRAFRQVTTLLTKAGVHVLRFDYFGTGDSAGDGEDATIPQWLEDIDTAIQELKDTAGVKTVSLIGLRFGATLAALASRGRSDLDRVVLWDPIVNGRSYLEEVLPIGWDGRRNGHPIPPPDQLEGTIGITGFPISARLREEILATDLLQVDRYSARQLHLIVSGEKAEYDALHDRWTELKLPGQYQHIPSEGNWAEGDRFGSALLPQQIIQGVIACLT